jgi:radical SAM protein with 4Fe4S-binding SPASM domain
MDPRYATLSEAPKPAYVVWELTLKCDLACRHCGSRAGVKREAELLREECLALVPQLAELKTREIAFIGGEAYLAPHWLEVVEAATKAGIRCTMTTGGRAFTLELAQAARKAGLHAISVSVDGLEKTHDRLRAVPGSWRSALAALKNAQSAGILPYANTQFNRLNLPEIDALEKLLMEHQIQAWQVQITGPMGRAADHPDWLLQPYEMLELIPKLAAAADRARAKGCTVSSANNLGYYGPYEGKLRLAPFAGCQAGTFVLGIEANGDIKGCPSLPSGPYVGGNVRQTPLKELWENNAIIRFARDREQSELWGHCAGCYYAPVCKGGCSWTAHTLLGRRGNMPYCYHRAEQLAQKGIRERIVQVERAPGEAFDFGRFELVEEPIATLCQKPEPALEPQSQ